MSQTYFELASSAKKLCSNFRGFTVYYCASICTFIFFLQSIRPAMQAASEAEGKVQEDFSPLAMFAFFVNRVKENLHIIIAFSPIGDAFRNRLRQFPSLINCCTIDWFQVSVTKLQGYLTIQAPAKKSSENVVCLSPLLQIIA